MLRYSSKTFKIKTSQILENAVFVLRCKHFIYEPLLQGNDIALQHTYRNPTYSDQEVTVVIPLYEVQHAMHPAADQFFHCSFMFRMRGKETTHAHRPESTC